MNKEVEQRMQDLREECVDTDLEIEGLKSEMKRLKENKKDLLEKIVKLQKEEKTADLDSFKKGDE